MKHDEAKPHPGPFQIPRVDAEFAGILVAVGFLVLGVVGLPIAKWFLLGAIVLGGAVAVVLRWTRRRL